MAGELKSTIRKADSTQKQAERVDMEKVERIVEKMRKKYSAQGVQYEKKSTGKMGELRGIISGGQSQGIEVQKISDLKDSDNKMVRHLGGLYLAMGGIMTPFYKVFGKLPWSKQLEFYLYSANMKYSAKQWLALTTITSLIAFIVVLIIMLLLVPFSPIPIELAVGIAFFAFFFAIALMGLVPKQRAQARGKAISRELPFALRHIATQLSAGIGLYRTLQTVASADYGELSEEFSRTITEIEEGTDTQLALRHLALRTQSPALRNALMHTIRALKTGGNLSNIMNEIADDVSFELRMKMKEFGEKMNFLGVIFIFMAIVIPVFVAIMGGVRNSPIMAPQEGGMMVTGSFRSMPLDLNVMMFFFLMIMPAILVWLFMFITMIQPHV